MFLGFRVDQPGSVLLSCGIRSEHAFKDEVVQRSFRMICGTTQKGRINMQIQVAHSPIFLVKVVNSNGFGALVNIAHTSIRCIDDCCYCSLSPNQHFVLATSATSWTWFYHTSGGWFVFFWELPWIRWFSCLAPPGWPGRQISRSASDELPLVLEEWRMDPFLRWKKDGI
jgi:hypothetical protein